MSLSGYFIVSFKQAELQLFVDRYAVVQKETVIRAEGALKNLSQVLWYSLDYTLCYIRTGQRIRRCTEKCYFLLKSLRIQSAEDRDRLISQGAPIIQLTKLLAEKQLVRKTIDEASIELKRMVGQIRCGWTSPHCVDWFQSHFQNLISKSVHLNDFLETNLRLWSKPNKVDIHLQNNDDADAFRLLDVVPCRDTSNPSDGHHEITEQPIGITRVTASLQVFLKELESTLDIFFNSKASEDEIICSASSVAQLLSTLQVSLFVYSSYTQWS